MKSFQPLWNFCTVTSNSFTDEVVLKNNEIYIKLLYLFQLSRIYNLSYLVWPSLACLVARGARAEALVATECLWKSFKSADTEWCWLNRLLPDLVLFLSWPGTVLMLESPKNNKVCWCTLYYFVYSFLTKLSCLTKLSLTFVKLLEPFIWLHHFPLLSIFWNSLCLNAITYVNLLCWFWRKNITFPEKNLFQKITFLIKTPIT